MARTVCACHASMRAADRQCTVLPCLLDSDPCYSKNCGPGTCAGGACNCPAGFSGTSCEIQGRHSEVGNRTQQSRAHSSNAGYQGTTEMTVPGHVTRIVHSLTLVLEWPPASTVTYQQGLLSCLALTEEPQLLLYVSTLRLHVGATNNVYERAFWVDEYVEARCRRHHALRRGSGSPLLSSADPCHGKACGPGSCSNGACICPAGYSGDSCEIAGEHSYSMDSEVCSLILFMQGSSPAWLHN